MSTEPSAIGAATYGSNTSSAIARDSSELSMPHITSPSGLPAVSDAFDSIVPVSPATRISTSMPVSALNSASASLSEVSASGNES